MDEKGENITTRLRPETQYEKLSFKKNGLTIKNIAEMEQLCMFWGRQLIAFADILFLLLMTEPEGPQIVRMLGERERHLRVRAGEETYLSISAEGNPPPSFS